MLLRRFLISSSESEAHVLQMSVGVIHVIQYFCVNFSEMFVMPSVHAEWHYELLLDFLIHDLSLLEQLYACSFSYLPARRISPTLKSTC